MPAPAAIRRMSASLRPDHYDLGNAFLRWVTGYRRFGAAIVQNNEFIMGPMVSRRFAIGLDDDGIPVLAAGDEEIGAIEAVSWDACAFVRNVRRRDWVTLSSSSLVPTAPEPLPARLWLPAENGVMAGWLGDNPPARIRIRKATIRAGKPEPGEAVRELPLLMKGDWSA